MHATLFDIDGAAQFFEHARGSGDRRIALAKIGDDFESVTYFGGAGWDQRTCASLGWNFVAVGPELGGIETYTGVHL